MSKLEKEFLKEQKRINKILFSTSDFSKENLSKIFSKIELINEKMKG